MRVNDDRNRVRRCAQCGYIVDGLSEHRCPECGSPFDPNDPRTYRTGPQRPFLLSVRFWAAILLLFLLVALAAWYGRASYRRDVITEICTKCGSVRETCEHRVFRVLVWRQRRAASGTAVTRLLSESTGEHDHAWRTIQIWRYDWRNRRFHPSPMLMDSGLWILLNKVGPEERVLALGREFPELPVMITRDILDQQNPDVVFRGCDGLFHMCRARDVSEVRARFQVWKFRDWLYKRRHVTSIVGGENSSDTDSP